MACSFQVMPNNPRLSVVEENKYIYRPPYEIKGKNSLVKVLKRRDLDGKGGILLSELAECIPNAEKTVQVCGGYFCYPTVLTTTVEMPVGCFPSLFFFFRPLETSCFAVRRASTRGRTKSFSTMIRIRKYPWMKVCFEWSVVGKIGVKDEWKEWRVHNIWGSLRISVD